MTDPIYRMPSGNFPMQGGKPVRISKTEFRKCCCDEYIAVSVCGATAADIVTDPVSPSFWDGYLLMTITFPNGNTAACGGPSGVVPFGCISVTFNMPYDLDLTVAMAGQLNTSSPVGCIDLIPPPPTLCEQARFQNRTSYGPVLGLRASHNTGSACDVEDLYDDTDTVVAAGTTEYRFYYIAGIGSAPAAFPPGSTMQCLLTWPVPA